MSNLIELNQIIRKVSARPNVVPGEEVIVSVKRTPSRTSWTLFPTYQDYLVANSRNPLRVACGNLSPYPVRDVRNGRTLTLNIYVAAQCPPGKEVQVAQALHGETEPTQVFIQLMQRWLREYIPTGQESRFIDSYDAVQGALQTHLVDQAGTQTGLELSVTVSLSRPPSGPESAAPSEMVVGPLEIGLRWQDYPVEQRVTVEAGLALDQRHYVRAYVQRENVKPADELFKFKLKEYFIGQVTLRQFIQDRHYAKFKQPLLDALSFELAEIGRRVTFINFTDTPDLKLPDEFVAIDYDHEHRFHGRTEPVVIQNTVQLYCTNPVAFFSSGITDLKSWVVDKLNAILKRHLIGKTYVALLLHFDVMQLAIKRDLSDQVGLVGYTVDHLLSIPNQQERAYLEPFSLSFEKDFETKLDKFDVQLKFDVRLRIGDLQLIENDLNRGADIEDVIEKAILAEASQILRNILPERFYLHFTHPDESDNAQTEEERKAVRDLLIEKISEQLRIRFGAEIFELTPRVGSTELTERYYKLRDEIRLFKVTLPSRDPQTEPLTLSGNFEIRGVYSDSAGWHRFSAMRLDLDGLQVQLQNHLRAELKNYRLPDLVFQNRIWHQRVFERITGLATDYMRREFGLIVHLTNLDRNTTGEELLEGVGEWKQYQLLINKIQELKNERIELLARTPLETETLREYEETLQLLQNELQRITASGFGQLPPAERFELQEPDKLPDLTDDQPVAVQYELETRPKNQLTN